MYSLNGLFTSDLYTVLLLFAFSFNQCVTNSLIDDLDNNTHTEFCNSANTQSSSSGFSTLIAHLTQPLHNKDTLQIKIKTIGNTGHSPQKLYICISSHSLHNATRFKVQSIIVLKKKAFRIFRCHSH